jgi:NAD+ diphosphatase
MTATTRNTFSGPYLDRRAEVRDAADWHLEARADSSTLFVVGSGLAHLVVSEPEPEIAFLRADHELVAAASTDSLTLLGWFRGTRCVLVDVPPELLDRQREQLPRTAALAELRPLAATLPGDSAGLLAYARALAYWRARHRFCGVCGTHTHATRAGHVLRCSDPACANDFFPRIDPAIIVLVTDSTGERALLGRQASWPRGRFSTIAGFVEPGESLEDAVVREVYEETGVRVASVAYQSSQPWPFPSSLMLGFHAVAATTDITHVDGELEDARWFSRAEIAAGTPTLPPPASISFRLIEAWFDQQAAVPLAALSNLARW